MIFQFGIVALGAILATVLVLAGHANAAVLVGGGCLFAFYMSTL